MSDLLKSSITSGLKDAGIYGDDATYNAEISLDAARSYLAFSKDKYAGLNVKEVDIKIFKGGNLFAEKSLKGQIDCGHNRGFANNLASIAKTVTAQKGNSEEIEDVKYCGLSIARTIGELGN
ncbi:MAG: hypothetical protein K0R98_852 [Rickettsiaceae bacterium]|jgi:hypothetical protein|nr:hypothetical protein [Rickettsiaceae bacterium]